MKRFITPGYLSCLGMDKRRLIHGSAPRNIYLRGGTKVPGDISFAPPLSPLHSLILLSNPKAGNPVLTLRRENPIEDKLLSTHVY